MTAKTGLVTEEKPEAAWRQHLPWVATLAAFSYATLKIAVVSGGDPAVARAVVTTANLPTLLLGIGALALPMLVAVIVYISLFTTLVNRFTKTPIVMPLTVFAISYILLAILAPFPALIGVPFTVLATLYALRAWDQQPRGENEMTPADVSWSARIGRLLSDASPQRRVAALVATVTLLVPLLITGLGSALDRTVWLPLELVCTSVDLYTEQGHSAPGDLTQAIIPCTSARTATVSGLKRIVSNLGYVIQEGSEWTTLLLEDERHVVRVPTKAIVARVLCRSTDAPPGPLFGSAIGPAADDQGERVQLGVAEYRCYPSVPLRDPRY